MKKTEVQNNKAHIDCLAGHFFHSIENGKVCWQGFVIGHVFEQYYLVQLFEWVMGEHSVQKMVSIAEMSPWLFYSDADEMKFSYEHGDASHLKEDIT
ncbi:MAG: hypothetical protein NTX45_11350 [Proteobacteria bacterium]|nr:hypothetical protein [Pseudomonadota bacterium]